MAEMKNPGARAGAAGADGNSKAASLRPQSNTNATRNANVLRLARFAALDPATLAALGLVAARLWGAVQ